MLIEERLANYLNNIPGLIFSPDGINGNIQIGHANVTQKGTFFITSMASGNLGHSLGDETTHYATQDYSLIYIGSAQFAASQEKIGLVSTYMKTHLVDISNGIISLSFREPTVLEVSEGGVYMFSMEVSIQYETK